MYIVSHRPLNDNDPTKDASGGGHDNVAYDATGDDATKEKGGLMLNLNSPYNEQPYRGMGKEDLLRHSSRPLWRRMRFVCISIVLLGWLALIVTVVALVLVYPRCRSPARQDWWQKEVVYRVYVPSFQDSDTDGWGDLAGRFKNIFYFFSIEICIISSFSSFISFFFVFFFLYFSFFFFSRLLLLIFIFLLSSFFFIIIIIIIIFFFFCFFFFVLFYFPYFSFSSSFYFFFFFFLVIVFLHSLFVIVPFYYILIIMRSVSFCFGDEGSKPNSFIEVSVNVFSFIHLLIHSFIHPFIHPFS